MEKTELNNSEQFTWRGIDHPTNALPIVPANAGKTLDVEAFAAYAALHKKDKKPEKGEGECAHYVALALKTFGIDVPNCPYSACQYVYHLPQWGFGLIASGICDGVPDRYEPQIGDICVLAAGPESVHGHICIYTKAGWCSDWIYETGMNPYEGQCQYAIFRWTEFGKNKINFPNNVDGTPVKRIFSEANNRQNCFFIVSKIHPEHLNVYETVGDKTFLLASYPVCLGKNKGQRVTDYDKKTPESFPGREFYINGICDSSNWKYDHEDGRGAIHTYGKWFMRLHIPNFTSIGIHGSTNERESIAIGRGSEGCIRLLDEDIIHLHDNYADVGTKVIILPEGMEPLLLEMEAMDNIGLHHSEHCIFRWKE